MKKFREFSENVEYLAKLYVTHYDADIDISLYRPHLELLMKYRETDRFMLFFEKVIIYSRSLLFIFFHKNFCRKNLGQRINIVKKAKAGRGVVSRREPQETRWNENKK